jgi:hypothetical protein
MALSRIRGTGQIPTTPRTVARRGQCLGPIRRRCRRQPRALAARLPTGLAILRSLPRQAIRPPFSLGRDRILRWRDGGIGRITPQPGASSSAIRTWVRPSCDVKPPISAASSSYEGDGCSGADTTQMIDDQTPENEPDTPSPITERLPRSTHCDSPAQQFQATVECGTSPFISHLLPPF